MGEVLEGDRELEVGSSSIHDTREDARVFTGWLGGDKEGVIDGRAGSTVNHVDRFTSCTEGFCIKVTKADADHTVLLRTCSS